MLLTGKCKEDFLIHLKETRRCNEKSFSEFPAIFEDALIIEWLDSVGIYVTILPCIDKTFDSYVTINKKRIEVSQFNETRSEATQKAILKANEIYNNLNKQ